MDGQDGKYIDFADRGGEWVKKSPSCGCGPQIRKVQGWLRSPLGNTLIGDMTLAHRRLKDDQVDVNDKNFFAQGVLVFLSGPPYRCHDTRR